MWGEVVFALFAMRGRGGGRQGRGVGEREEVRGWGE